MKNSIATGRDETRNYKHIRKMAKAECDDLCFQPMHGDGHVICRQRAYQAVLH